MSLRRERSDRQTPSFLAGDRSTLRGRVASFLSSPTSLLLSLSRSLCPPTINRLLPSLPLDPVLSLAQPDPHTIAFSALIDRPSSPCVARPSPSSRSPLSLSPFPAPTPALSLALPSAAHVINRVALHLPGPPVSRLFPRPAPLSGRLTLGFSLQDILRPRPPLTLASAASVER